MRLKTGALIAIGIAIAGSPAASFAAGELRLTAQRAEGARRICVYGSGKEAQAKRIGRGEPCPQRFRATRKNPELVPSLALRVGEGRTNGQAVCLYRYAGRDYRALRPVSMSCPLTPGSGMEVLKQDNRDAG